MIRIRGRNGFFTFRSFSAWVGKIGRSCPVGLTVKHGQHDGDFSPAPDTLEVIVDIFSNSPHTRSAPVQFIGPPREVSRLLRRIAAEIEAGSRANSGATVKTKKEGKA